jgi:hypothetical protein
MKIHARIEDKFYKNWASVSVSSVTHTHTSLPTPPSPPSPLPLLLPPHSTSSAPPTSYSPVCGVRPKQRRDKERQKEVSEDDKAGEVREGDEFDADFDIGFVCSSEMTT